MYGMADIAGASEFLSGDSFVSGGDEALLGLLGELLGSGMSSPPGMYGADPVSALLGFGSDIAGMDPGMMGAEDLLGAWYNPVSWFRKKQAAAPAMAKQALVRRAINAKLQQHGAAVTTRQNTKARRYPCPLPATVVAGGASATITVNPQTLYRPERFVIAASLAPSFVVTDIKVGNVSQLPATGDVPGELFAQNGVDCQIQFDTVNPALNLLVVVTNITGGALTFRGAFIGTNIQ